MLLKHADPFIAWCFAYLHLVSSFVYVRREQWLFLPVLVSVLADGVSGIIFIMTSLLSSPSVPIAPVHLSQEATHLPGSLLVQSANWVRALLFLYHD